MAKESKRSRFLTSMFALILYTLACAAIPIYHQVTGRDLKPALNVNLDSIYLFIFLLGTAIIVVAVGLNRRIEALEAKSAPTLIKDGSQALGSRSTSERP